ncbi:MAG TPA: DMT family transporter [Acidobacteriota bacterium]|nr:DMT family transporter [Acidobacteriota bacterium]
MTLWFASGDIWHLAPCPLYPSDAMAVYIKLILTALFWGGTFIAGRALAQNVGPYSAAFLRFLLASGLLFLIVRRFHGGLPRLEKDQAFAVFILGMTGVFAYNAFFFSGLRLVDAGRASLIIANNPIVITVFSAIIFRERLTPLKLLGILLSVTGALVVISKGSLAVVTQGGIGRGEIYIMGCVASWATYSLVGKVVLKRLSPLVSVCYSAAIGTLCLLGPALWEGMLGDLGEYVATDWLSIVYLGVFGTVFGFVWYYQGIQAIGAVRASLFINFVPIFAILLAYLILDEPITLSLLAGAAFISVGVYLTNDKLQMTSGE